MRRRLTITIVAVVTGALLLAGIGTLVLARRAARLDTERDMRNQAEAIAQAADDVARPGAIVAIRRALKLENATLAHQQPRTGVWIELPPGVSSDDLAGIDASGAVSGTHGSLAFAAAMTTVPRGRAAIVLTRHLPASGGVGYFFLAAAIALLVAAVVGDRLGHRIAKPLEDAEAATKQIATGDLAVRVPTATHADPEMRSLATSINAMAENLARRRGLERQFLLSVSHDLRTPLTSIRGFAEAIAEGVSDDHERAAEVIAAEARRLERLVGDLLDLARLDARQFPLDVRAVDVGEIVRATAEGFRPATADAQLVLAVTVDDAPLVANVDPERLAQVVANLVENALKFASARIDVAVERGAQEVTIAVSDDGPGIAADDQGRVFDRLYQPPRDDGAQPRQVGSGLGLAIVAELVGAMGGTVRATTAPGGGTRVIVALSAATTSTSV